MCRILGQALNPHYLLSPCNIPGRTTNNSTVDSRYYDTDGIRKMYQYNQTIDITSLNFYCLGMVGIQIWYRNKQYFVISEIVIGRLYCTSQFDMKLDPFASLLT